MQTGAETDWQQLAAMLDAVPLPTVAVSKNLRILRMNRAASEWTREEGAQAESQARCHELLYHRVEPCPFCPLAAEPAIQAGETRQELIHTSGAETDERTLRISFTRAAHHGIELVEMIQDVTSEREYQEEESRRENLAALGVMVSGIAHELNNPLTGIGLNLQGLMANLATIEPKEVLKRLQMLRKDLTRASQIVSDILSFSRPGALTRSRGDLAEIIQKAKAATIRLYPVLSSRVEWILESHDDVEFSFNPEKIERLLVNLFKNSLAALDYKPGFIKVSSRRVRRWIHFTVEDNAGGIPHAELKKIFHPFYTTSQDGRGSGLGLSISHSIVKQHGGRIRVRSSGGRTRFYVSLPVDP